MRRLLLVAMAVLVISTGAFAKLDITLEGAANIAIGDATVFMLDGGGILDLNENISLRANFFRLRLTEGTALYLRTGSEMDVLYYFPMNSMDPYAIAGLQFTSMENSTIIVFNIGGGVDFKISNPRMRPFAELIIGIYSSSFSYMGQDVDNSETTVSVRGGIHFDLSGK